jgi:O-antigen/teichoic acid export membrane protein
MSEPGPSRPTDVKRVLARNAAWNYGGFVVNVVTNLLLFPFVVRHLGEAASGIWLLLGSLTGYMGLLELGIVPSLTQHVASALGAGNRRAIDRTVSTALVVLSAMMFVALQGLWLVSPLVGLLQVPSALETDAQLVFAVSIVGVALRMPLAAYQAVLLGSQRQDRCNQLWIVLALSKAFATTTLLLLGFGVVALVVMEATAHLLAGVLQIRWVRQEVPDLRLSWRDADRRNARALVGFGGAVLLTNLCALVIEQTDRFVIGVFLPVQQVTHYAAAWKVYMMAFSLPTILLQALSPVIGHLHGHGDRRAVREVFLRMTKYSGAVALPLSVSVGLSSGVLLHVWMGPSFSEARLPVQVLLVAFAVTAFNHAGHSTLLGLRKVAGLLPLYYVPQAILNLAVSLLLVTAYGPLGVALGTAVPALVLEYAFIAYVLRQVDVPLGEFLQRAVRPAVWPLPVAFAPLAIAYASRGPDWVPLVPLAGISAVLYAGLFWAWSLNRSERDDVLRLVRMRLWRPVPQES